jgi:DNA replication protein DnaC
LDFRAFTSLFIFGPTGTGKSHLAAAIVREWMERGRRARFTRFAEYCESLQDGFASSVSAASTMAEYVRPPLLALDDLGTGKISDFERRSALELIARRGTGVRPTIVTSNMSLEEISARLDDRIASRLGQFKAVEMLGEDFRLRRIT